MADPAIVDDPFLDDEGERAGEYQEEAQKELAKAIAKQNVALGTAEPNPGGAAGQVDPEREERAYAANAGGVQLTRIEQAYAEKFGILPPNAGVSPLAPEGVANLIKRNMQLESANGPVTMPAPAQERVVGGVVYEQGPAPIGANPYTYIITALWGGKFTVEVFKSLEVLQGAAQKVEGEKRIFAIAAAQDGALVTPDYSNKASHMCPEITALGVPILR